MNNKEIYINGILVDLDEGNNPIQLTYAINDLAELKDRQAYSTNTFKLPLTATNRRACGFPDNANLIQEQPYRKNSAKIIQSGIEIIPNGIAVITKANKSIEVQILSGLIGFFDILGNKNIRDLDLSQWDHIWDLNTVMLSQNNTEGYVWPVIDYGGLSETDRAADIAQLRPATFRKTIIEAIIREAGYTASGSYTSYDKYQRSIVPFTNDKFEHGKAFVDATSTISAAARNTVPQTLSNDYRDFIIVFQDKAVSDPGNHWNGSMYTATSVARVHVTANYNLDIRDQYKGGNTPQIGMSIQLSKSNGEWINIAYNPHPTQGDFVSFVYVDQVLEVDADLSPGDRLRVFAHSDPATNRVLGIVQQGASISIKYTPTDVIYGQSVQLAATLPDITQKNFFKDFLQNFGLIVIPDNYTNKLLLLNMEDVYANKPIAADITNKLIDSEDEVNYSFSSYGINNYGKYKTDDAVPDGTGQGTMVLDNLTLDDSVTLFTSVFAATLKVNKLNGLFVSEIKKIDDPAKSSEFKTKTEPRILLNNNQNTLFDLYYGNTHVQVNSISMPTFDGLDYNTLFEDNYPEIKKMLYRPFAVVKEILLKEIDIANIDWTIPVYDRKSASYYYKNEIKYIQGDISTISLIKLP
jgi:hypothetical protein